MAFRHNLSQEMDLQQHFSDQQQSLPPDNSSSVLIPPQPQSSSDGKPPDHAPPHTWLNSAILRQPTPFNAPAGPGGGAAAAADANFLNLHTNSADSSSTHHHSQWLSRSILRRNGDDVQLSNDSVIAAASASHDSAADFNNNTDTNTNTTANNADLSDTQVAAADGAFNWQSARCKAEILAHPLYEQLLSAHVACLRIATPVDQLPRIDAQLAQSQHVVAKYSALGHGIHLGDDKELDQFMVLAALLLLFHCFSISLFLCFVGFAFFILFLITGSLLAGESFSFTR